MTTASLRVLVTGATGFIGRRLVGRLIAMGMAVSPWRGDIRSLPQCSDRVNAVIHLAALTRPAQFADTPGRLSQVNVEGTRAALSYCERTNAGLILASTCGVYAQTGQRCRLDESALIGPRTAYACSKRQAEELCQDWVEAVGLSCVVLRLFNVYGPGQDRAFVIPQIAAARLAGQPAPLRHPRAVLDFLHVDDAAAAFACALSGLGQSRCRFYNIGSGQGHTLAAVDRLAAELVVGRLGTPDVDEPAPDIEAVHMVADPTKAQAELGWTAAVSLRHGLHQVLCALGPLQANGSDA
jgi:nucleoside-diphosphate-sugar epimerase